MTLNAIAGHCKTLHLSALAEALPRTLTLAQEQNWTPEAFLLELLEQEIDCRQERRIERLLRGARLPFGKTMAEFDLSRLPLRLQRQIPLLTDGVFIEQAENILIFGQPGTGKTHLIAALAREWVQHGYPVLFTPTFKLVDALLRAKRDYELEAQLKRLDRYRMVILDDFGYVQQSREEMEVLFTFLAERYERRSVAITSNLVFSQWDQIFKDPLTTAAAIDRVVHHSRIIEFGAGMTSMRAEQAAQRYPVSPAPVAEKE